MKAITIGRHTDNDIVIDNPQVSRHHCKCFTVDGKYYVEDLNSVNGVTVDGSRIEALTEFFDSSQIKIPTKVFEGKDLIQLLGKEPEQVDETENFLNAEKNFAEIRKRYLGNLKLLLNEISIETTPYQIVFSNDDAKVEFYVNEYDKKVSEAISILKLMSRNSVLEQISFNDNMSALAEKIVKTNESSKLECADIRQRILNEMKTFQNSLYNQLLSSFRDFISYYLNIFSSYQELRPVEDDSWDTSDNNRIVSTPFFIYGYHSVEYPIFEKNIRINFPQIVPFFKRNNLIVRHQNISSETASTVVNNILGRVLSASQSGNVVIHTVDIRNLGGTSNIFKMLDKHVYSICAKNSDLNSFLTSLERHVENVIQNMLIGSYKTIADYNLGKERQEPYHIVVFKDFPHGITPDIANTIQRIIANGTQAGVQFIFMVNDDLLKMGEDNEKIRIILHLDDASALQATEINLSKKPDDILEQQQYALLNDGILHDIVQRVNAGFEVKAEEILRLTDYMIPKEEWWTKQSANRTDIPFGISSNKQIQKLNITQESGQNAAVVIGIPGSGKSVFLHALIASAAINYSPRELQMYLLDFSGVEFNVYANHKLPHARVIAPEAEREFGLSILREVFEEGNRRMTLCRENGVTNIVELKRKNPDVIVPRLLVVIDEFQKIFEIENDNISKEANAKIHAIIQEYRKFGINLILATQKLPAKSIIPYDLIANRVVFKSDPNDFDNLIKWSHSVPQPRLLTGTCVYNNESGTAVANSITRSFFINASKELENLLDEVAAFAEEHRELTDNHELRTFRSDELPVFTERIVTKRHYEPQEAPREVGVYVGESIAIAPCHVYVPLTKDSNNNILFIGGIPSIAKGIAYHAMVSAIAGHTEKACNVILMNFMMEDDPVQDAFQSDMFSAISEYCNIQEANSADDVKDYLQFVKDEVIDARKSDPSLPLTHFFISIFEFQRGRMFDGVGNRGDMQSECARLLEYIMKNGPMVGVFTLLQVDNLANLNRIGYGIHNLFCHRIALQMSEQDSDKVVGNSAANKLLVLNRPATNYRALYYNNINSSCSKFKPYQL